MENCLIKKDNYIFKNITWLQITMNPIDKNNALQNYFSHTLLSVGLTRSNTNMDFSPNL